MVVNKRTEKVEVVTTKDVPTYDIVGLSATQAGLLMSILTQGVYWASSGELGQLARDIYVGLEKRGGEPSRWYNTKSNSGEHDYVSTVWKEDR